MTSLLVFLLPAGALLLACAALEERRVARVTAVAFISFALVVFFYGLLGFGIQFGGVGISNSNPSFKNLVGEWSPLDVLFGPGWGLVGVTAFGTSLAPANADVANLFIVHAALAGTAVMLPIMALAARVRSRILILGALPLGLVFYPLIGNWVWGGGWLSQLGNTSELGHGFVDYAGTGLVYLFGGFAVLGALLGSGARSHTQVTTSANIPEYPSAHLPLLMVLAAFLFLVGLGASSSSDPLVPRNLQVSTVLFNLVNSAIAGLIVAALYGWFVSGEPSAMLAARGFVAGMVAVAASMPFISGWSALIIGGIAGLILPLATYLVDRWIRVDDQALLVSTFGAPGVWGLLALAIFADGQFGIGWNKTGLTTYLGVANQGVTGIFAARGFVPDSPGQMEAQFFGLLAISLLSFAGSWLVFFTLRRLVKS